MAYRFANVVVDPARRTLAVGGNAVPVGSRAFDLLVALVERRDRVVGKDELIDIVWPRAVVEENNLQVHISSLRKLLGAPTIATVARRGYRFTQTLEDDAQLSAANSPSFAQNTSPAPPTNLPASEPELIGRGAELQALCELVRAHRLVSTCGAGGMGKTTLALSASYALRGEFPDGVWLVQLAPVTQARLVPTVVARALHLTLDEEGRPEAVASAISAKRLLLVLDNCEHLLAAAAELAALLLSSAPGVHLLVTSQEPLKVQGEHVFRLPAMTLPAQASLEHALESDAVTLFATRAAAADPSFKLTPANIAAVIDICRRLDGIALAIEFGAARVRLLGVEGLQAKLNHRFRILTTGSRLALPRHQTLRAAMEWSHALLTEAEQRAFRRLGVFVGSFSLEAAEQVVADSPDSRWEVLDLLGSLVDKSLVVAQPGAHLRYRLLETSRAFALEQLASTSELDRTCLRHAEAMADLFARSCEEEHTSTMPALLAKYVPDLDNARAALDWLGSRPEHALVHVALAGAMGWLWIDAALRPEGMRRTSEAAAHIPAGTPPPLEARLRIRLARVSFPLGNAELVAGTQRAVDILRDAGRPEALYLALVQAGTTHVRAGLAAQAEQFMSQAHALLDTAWPPALRIEYFAARGIMLGDAGRAAESLPHFEQVLALARQCGDPRRVLRAMINIEQVSVFFGDYTRAVALGQEMVEMLTADQSLRGGFENLIISNLGVAHLLAGNIDESVRLARESYGSVQRAGRAYELLDSCALLALKRGRKEDAARIMGRSIARFQQVAGKRQFVEQQIHDGVLADLQRALPAESLERLLAQGAALDDEDALQLALRD